MRGAGIDRLFFLKSESAMRVTVPRFSSLLVPLLSGLLLLSACSDVSVVDERPTVAVALDAELRYDVQTREAGCVTGTQTSGALFEVCLPEGYDGTLVIYAHGFIFPQLPLTIPAVEGGLATKEFILERDHGYAATSYYTNGLVDPIKGIKDIRELISIFTREFERPSRTYIIGFSNGAFLSTLLMEKSSGLIDGALVSCGPTGSYLAEIEYLGDVSVLFDHFFGDVQILPTETGFGTGLPGDATGYHPALIPTLEAVAAGMGVPPRDLLGFFLVQALQNNPQKTGMLLEAIQSTSAITRGRTLFISAEEAVTLVVFVMVYSAFNVDDVHAKLGGDFFDNRARVYADLHPNTAFSEMINTSVERYTAERDVMARLRSQYESKGNLRVPSVALHTVRDPLVPRWHQDLYLEKLGSRSWIYDVVDVNAFGHCSFSADNLVDAFTSLTSSTLAVR
jgi:hypothetical protein